MKVTGTFNGIWPRVQKWFWSRTKKKWHSIGPAQLMRGFAGFQVLVSGCQLGLFAVLSRKPNRTAQEISTELKLPQRSANALLLCMNG